MSSIIINGGKKVSGEVYIDGSKNSVLPILVSCIITNSITTLKNCPKLSDVDVTLDILKSLGCKVFTNKDVITIDSTSVNNFCIDKDNSCKMRASIIFLGALLSKFKKAKMYVPGGCNLGKRPIDLHIDALCTLGCDIKISEGEIVAKANVGIKSGIVKLKIASVGATENIIIASCTKNAIVKIENAAREPEIVDLCNFLNSCGANIVGAGTSTITINGVEKLHNTTYSIMPDRIVTVSYLAICAVCGGELLLKNTDFETVKEMLPYFTKIGCELKIKSDSIHIKSNGNVNGLGTITTAPYPSFPTDAQPIFVAMATNAKSGVSTFIETIFENRYVYTREILKFGARIYVDENVATVYSGCLLDKSTRVKATDLRGGMALIILACAINEKTIIDDVHHIYRGYSNIVQKLKNIGIDIKENMCEQKE